jgi:hypothetical protein
MKDPKNDREENGGNTPRPRRQAKAPSKDITPVLQSWEYEAGSINVRKVNGLDGSPKLQMRLDLGLLQMEMTGRPDGERPNGKESLLDLFEEQLRDHTASKGNGIGFSLTPEQCQMLREEAVMYYQRYLSLFVLEEYPGVIRDTDRNLRVLDICSKYAVEEQDRLVLEQYRPYITMMNARAKASMLVDDKRFGEALKCLDEGIEKIRGFYERFGQESAFERSNEVRVLKRFTKDIRRKLPVDPMERLRRRLDRAVREERYEEAAKIRDEIGRRGNQGAVAGQDAAETL